MIQPIQHSSVYNYFIDKTRLWQENGEGLADTQKDEWNERRKPVKEHEKGEQDRRQRLPLNKEFRSVKKKTMDKLNCFINERVIKNGVRIISIFFNN